MTIKPKDRVKEISLKTGTSNSISLNGVATSSFRAFSSAYSASDQFAYCMTDGVKFEIGYATYINSSSILRSSEPNSIVSSDGNTPIDWGVGVKDVFVIDRAENQVVTSKFGDLNEPAPNSVAVFNSINEVSGHTDLTYESGHLYSNEITASGNANLAKITINSQEQTTAHIDNSLNNTTEIDQILSLSGDSSQIIGLKSQSAGSVFAGPIADCGSEPCPSGYPEFRPLTSHDIPVISSSNVSYSPDDTSEWPSVPSNNKEALDSLSQRVNKKNNKVNDSVNPLLGSGTFEIRSSGNTIFLDVNLDGTIKSLQLGIVT